MSLRPVVQTVRVRVSLGLELVRAWGTTVTTRSEFSICEVVTVIPSTPSPYLSSLTSLSTTLFTCSDSIQGRCYVLLLPEFGDVVLSCFMFSRSTILTEVLPTQPEDSSVPLFKAILYSGSWDRKLADTNPKT